MPEEKPTDRGTGRNAVTTPTQREAHMLHAIADIEPRRLQDLPHQADEAAGGHERGRLQDFATRVDAVAKAAAAWADVVDRDVLREDAPRDQESITAMTAEIQAAVKDRKGSVQSPKQVVIVESLPLTGLGKPDKKAVRAKFWEGAGRAVG